MRNPKPGELIYEWRDFEFIGLSGIVKMTKEIFEENYGEFIAMTFPQNSIKPYAIWSKTHVVLFLNEDCYGIASITREPSEFMFG
jgi:hypothetical protein